MPWEVWISYWAASALRAPEVAGPSMLLGSGLLPWEHMAPVSIAAMQQSTQRVVSYSVLSLSKNVHDAKTPKLALVFSLIRWFWALKPKNPPPILIACLPVNLINSYLQLGNMWDMLSVHGYEKGKHDFSLSHLSSLPARFISPHCLCFWSTVVPCSGLIF